MSFFNDIQLRDTAVFPVVTFNLLDGSTYRISIKPFRLDGEPSSPLLLSSPSIKESIDLENRKYKISNVSLKISNVEYNGLRFTDTQIPMNTEVLIHWVSPSCTTLTQGEEGSCYLAYKGVVRSITHDEKTCNIILEDISQSTLHKKVPVTLLEDIDIVPDKYKNKPVPMVYGSVERSPCVISHVETGTEWYEEGALSYTVLMDRFPIFSVVHDLPSSGAPYARVKEVNPKGFLYVEAGGDTHRVTYDSKFYEGTFDNPYPGQLIDENVSLGDIETGAYANVTFSAYYDSGGGLTAKNPAGDNYVEAEAVRVPISGSAYLIGLSALGQYDGDESSLANINLPLSDAFDGLSETAIEIDRHLVSRVYNQNDFKGMAMSFKIDSIGDDNVDETATWILASIRMSCYSGDGCTYYVENFTAGVDGSERVAIITGDGGAGVSIDNYFLTPIAEVGYTSWDIENSQESLITTHSRDTSFYSTKVTNWITPNEGNSIRVYDLTSINSDYNGLEMSQDIHGVALYQRMLVNDPVSRNFYANVKGRTSS